MIKTPPQGMSYQYLINKPETTNDLRLKSEFISQRLKKIDDFSAGISDWVYTPGIEVVDGMLTMASGIKVHVNVALFKGIKNARGIEVTVGADGDPKYTRLAFGNNLGNFVYSSPGASASAFYRTIAGKLDTNIDVAFGHPDATTGDKIKAVLHGQNIQYFYNGSLLGTMVVSASKMYVLPRHNSIMAGVAFRAPTDAPNIDSVVIYPNRPYKYMHFSIDDSINIFKDLKEQENLYTSIFNNSTFAFFKSMHDKYGAKFSLYLFYSDGTWDLGSMTTKFASEFRENADWLKLGFHAYDGTSDYGNGTILTADALSHYNLVVNAIRTFASGYNIDTVIRPGYFGGSLDICRAWRDAECSVRGFLTADDDRESQLYLDATQRYSLSKCDDYLDTAENLYFVKTDLRIENFADPVAEFESRKVNVDYAGQMDILEVFTHEGRLRSATDPAKIKIENVCKWAIQNGYIFAFPMDYIPEC